jgi:hypothetical protein
MRRKRAAHLAVGVAVVAVTACGGTATSTTVNVTSTPTTRVTSTPTVIPLDAGTEGRVCAGLNAMANQLTGTTGTGSQVIATVAGALHVSSGQVDRAISDRCPQFRTLEGG